MSPLLRKTAIPTQRNIQGCLVLEAVRQTTVQGGATMSKINWLFVDLNSYFASVEQELVPELRRQPIGIIPIDADNACCIAASCQAKMYGGKTGCRALEAKELCPHIVLIPARPRLYVEFHHRIAAAIERCIPIQSVMSCDELEAGRMPLGNSSRT